MELYELKSQRPRTLVIKKLSEIGIPKNRIITPEWSNKVIARLAPSETLAITMFRWIYVEKYKPSLYKLTKDKKQIYL
jgi:hypothetical protein